jgi:hypothetical protein
MPEIIKALTPIVLAVCGTAMGMTIILSKVDPGPVAWSAISSIIGAAGGMGVASRTPIPSQEVKSDNVLVDESK